MLEATGRHLLWGGVLISDRNRLDLRFRDAGFSWRYRNRVTGEKEFSIGRFKFNPYARGELYYDSRYDKASRTELSAGSVFPITRRVELEGYFLHQNDTGGTSNRIREWRGYSGQPLFLIQGHASHSSYFMASTTICWVARLMPHSFIYAIVSVAASRV